MSSLLIHNKRKKIQQERIQEIVVLYAHALKNQR